MTDPLTKFTAAELLDMTFPPIRWAVPQIIPEGATLLAGAPKVGKSFLAFGLAVEVASGGHALRTVPVDPGDVLYLALEDTGRRLQRRLRDLLDGPPAPDRLDLVIEAEPMPHLRDRLNRWLTAKPDARLVIVDVLARVRPTKVPQGMTAYDLDYDVIVQLKRIADRHGVALVIVHHTRKAAAVDFLDAVSGTQGLAGAADTVAVLERVRNTADATLSVTGRDVDERVHGLTLTDGGRWHLVTPRQRPETAPRIDLEGQAA